MQGGRSGPRAVNCGTTDRFVPVNRFNEERKKGKEKAPYDSRRLVTESRLSMKKSAVWRADRPRWKSMECRSSSSISFAARSWYFSPYKPIPYFRAKGISTGEESTSLSWEAYAVFVLTIRSASALVSLRERTTQTHEFARTIPPDDASLDPSRFKMLIHLSTLSGWKKRDSL